jgi:hypothetical protein
MNDKASWAKFRMPTWEEDISLNHDSTTSFNNFPSPAEMPIEEFKPGGILTNELLGGVSLADYVT